MHVGRVVMVRYVITHPPGGSRLRYPDRHGTRSGDWILSAKGTFCRATVLPRTTKPPTSTHPHHHHPTSATSTSTFAYAPAQSSGSNLVPFSYIFRLSIANYPSGTHTPSAIVRPESPPPIPLPQHLLVPSRAGFCSVHSSAPARPGINQRFSHTATKANTAMAGVQYPAGLAQLQAATSYAEQAAALRSLKDNIIGHVQRKEEWVQHGILDALAGILQNDDQAPKRPSGKETSQPGQPPVLAEHEVVRLLALQLLASIANGENLVAVILRLPPNQNATQEALRFSPLSKPLASFRPSCPPSPPPIILPKLCSPPCAC